MSLDDKGLSISLIDKRVAWYPDGVKVKATVRCDFTVANEPIPDHTILMANSSRIPVTAVFPITISGLHTPTVKVSPAYNLAHWSEEYVDIYNELCLETGPLYSWVEDSDLLNEWEVEANRLMGILSQVDLPHPHDVGYREKQLMYNYEVEYEELDEHSNSVKITLIVMVVLKDTKAYKVLLDIHINYEAHLLLNYNSLDMCDSESISIEPATLHLPTNRSILEDYIEGALLGDEVTGVIGVDRANHLYARLRHQHDACCGMQL